MNIEELSVTLDSWREQLAQDPNMGSIIQEATAELAQANPPIELLETMMEMFMETIESPESYPMVRDEIIQSELLDDEDLPPEFDEKYSMLMLCALDIVRDNLVGSAPPQPQGFADGGLASLGRNGDSMLAHINPVEARMLQRNYGSGTVNPATGLREFGFFKKLKKTFKKIAGPLLTITSIIPSPIQPWSLAANAVKSASEGNWLGAALSGFGAYAAPGGFGGFGEAAGSGVTGGLDTASSFGSLSGADGVVGALGGAGAGVTAASAAPGFTAGTLGSGISGGLSSGASGLSSSLAGLGSEMALPAMESLGGLGAGAVGSIADVGTYPGLLPQLDSDTMSNLNMAKKVVGTGKTVYNALNPPEPEQFGKQNTQRQMQSLGGAPGMSMNTSGTFGLGGSQSRRTGQMARFREGGLVSYSKRI